MALFAIVLKMSNSSSLFAEESSSINESVFQVSGSNQVSVAQDAMFNDESSSFTGNPMGSWLNWWPEDLVVAPIPSRSPEMGWGLALAAGYFLDLDKAHPETPKSTVGIGVKGTENSSYAAGLGGKFNLRNDYVRLKAGIAYININYKFFGIGNGAGSEGQSVDIAQKAPLLYLSGTYQIIPNLYLGLGFVGSEVETHAGIDDLDVPEALDLGLDLDLNASALEIPLQYDTRDDELFPHEGWLIGSRFVLSPKHKLNLAMDVAVGKHGAEFYFSIGEAF